MSTHLLHLHMDLEGTTIEVGQAWLRAEGRHESTSFCYAPSYLGHPHAYSIDPALPLREGLFQTRPDQRLFGCLADIAPDRWGRALLAEHAGTKKPMSEADILRAGMDELRMGALRIFDPEHARYVAPGGFIPTWRELPALMKAAYAVTEPVHSTQAVEQLWQAGSALGGANPKAMTQDDTGGLWLAKFSSSTDILDMVRWETLCLELAQAAGIDTPQHLFKPMHDGAVLLLRRFDRNARGRIGFISGHTLASAHDGIDYTYADLRDALIAHGGDPATDLPLLWKRMVFNLAISNQDDHLRNHGLLRRQEGWRLAPAYDLTPTHPRYQKPHHALSIGGEGNQRIEHALSVAGDYELDHDTARAMVEDIRQALEGWQERAARLGIPQRQISHMTPSIGLHLPCLPQHRSGKRSSPTAASSVA